MIEQLIIAILTIYFCVAITWVIWPSLNQKGKNVYIISVLFLAVISCWIFWPRIITDCFPKWDDDKLGDRYGALNTVFTGLAFAGLIFTILLQQRQIRDADEENILRRFENTFFRLQDAYKQIVDTTELNQARHFSNAKKLEAFERMSFSASQTICAGRLPWNKVTLDIVQKAWPTFFARFEDKLAHYFRVLYHIFKLIDSSEIDRENKDFYARLFRAQLTSAELTLLFFNGMTDYGENFKDYVERYALLKHFPKEIVDNNKLLLNFYKVSAYEDRTLLPHES